MSDRTPSEVQAETPAAIEVAIAVVERDGCLLIGQRPAGVPLAGLWEFPGGKVLPGESPAAAAVRECREETGLAVKILRDDAPQTHVYAHGELRLHFFHCQPATPAIEVAAPFRWVPRADLSRYEFPAANRPILRQLITS